MDDLPVAESGALKMPSPFAKTKKTGYGYIENIVVSTAKYKKNCKTRFVSRYRVLHRASLRPFNSDGGICLKETTRPHVPDACK